MVKKHEDLTKEMTKKMEKYENEKKEKIYELTLKKEDEYIKQYQKRQNLIRLERRNLYEIEKRNEELNEKEKKIENFKKKKRELIESKAKLASDMEKEKQELIFKFENALKKKKQIDAEIVKELFPEDEELYNRVKNMTNKVKDNKDNKDSSNNEVKKDK